MESVRISPFCKTDEAFLQIMLGKSCFNIIFVPSERLVSARFAIACSLSVHSFSYNRMYECKIAVLMRVFKLVA
jgi:hypothetical protein